MKFRIYEFLAVNKVFLKADENRFFQPLQIQKLMRLKLKFANLATSREENLESHCNSEFTRKIFRMADAGVSE